MNVVFGGKKIGEVESFEIGEKEYPKIVELDLKDGYSFCSGERYFEVSIITGSIPIELVKINGVVVGRNNNDK